MHHHRPAWRRGSRTFFVGVLLGMLVTAIPVIVLLIVALGSSCSPHV